ncbi:MAG: hypothetical protein WCI51_07440 [Lentisphaerota bacterium]
MKTLQITVRVIAVAMTAVLNLNAEIITGKDGTKYDVLSICKTNAIGIVANTTVNARGQNMAWISYNNMNPADQKRFGFDQAKYDAYILKMAGTDQSSDNVAAEAPRTPIAAGTPRPQYVIPKTTTREQYLQQQMQNNPIQGNQASVQGVSGVSPVIAGGVNAQAAAVATPATYAGLSTQEAKASMPGAAVGVSPSGIGINTPVANIGISPYGVAVNTPVTNVGVTKDYIGVQTPVGGIAITPGPVPEPVYYPVAPAAVVNNVPVVPVAGAIVPAQIPLVGIPAVSPAPVVVYSPVITAVDCPQPVYPVVNGYVAGPVYSNPVITAGTVQPVINYSGAYLAYMSNYGYGYSTYGWSANGGWRYGYGNYPCYRGWGGGGWGGYRGGCYSGGGWGRR